HNLKARHLDEALDDSKPIIFVDDFVGLGNQTIDIMQRWLEMPPTQELNEVRDVLPSAQQDALRGRKLAFVYVAGLDEGAPAIRTFLSDSDLDGVAYTHIRQSDLPTLASVFGGKAQLPAFREFCREAGVRALVDHNGKPRSEEWRREHALGYGGHELLFTSMFNTPTASLTALWAGSARNGWLPIFPRRDKN
ncbi:MAG: deoxynucleoside triphosphate triphosphohydrolase, partial [Nocardioidaceae bacterium]|nr:deoxynucleoside triphosphate triphosphohydrolase [Nocardioidaceae bacterium]